MPSPPASSPGPGTAAAPGPQMDQAALAMSMMNMAMQLLQSKGMGPTQAAMPSGGVQGAHPHMWGMAPQMPPPMQQYMCPPAVAMPQQDAQLKAHGDAMHMGPPGATVIGDPASGMAQGGDTRDTDNTSTVPPPPAGTKQPPLQPMGYSHGYNFPPMGGMPIGWPPANMVDQNRDSKLRPPAA